MMCVSIMYRKCESVELIEEIVIKFKRFFEGKEFDLFLEYVKILEDKLMRIKIE